MNYATEFTAVQNALGIKVNGMSDAAFRAADEQNADRISEINYDGIRGIWVDKVCVVMIAKGRVFTPTAAQSQQLFDLFWSSPLI